MNRDDINRIGLEAGISSHAFGLANEEAWQQVERFVAMVAAAEREACAKLETEAGVYTKHDLANAIRARGKQE